MRSRIKFQVFWFQTSVFTGLLDLALNENIQYLHIPFTFSCKLNSRYRLFHSQYSVSLIRLYCLFIAENPISNS